MFSPLPTETIDHLHHVMLEQASSNHNIIYVVCMDDPFDQVPTSHVHM